MSRKSRISALSAKDQAPTPASLPWTGKERLALALVLLIPLFVGISVARRVGVTFDEPNHITSGYTYWKTGYYRMDSWWHPPFTKLWMTLPLLWLKPKPFLSNPDFISGTDNPYSMFFLYHNTVPAATMVFWTRMMVLLWFIPLIAQCLRSKPYFCEIIFVEDGSRDATKAAAEQALSGFPSAKILSFAENRGKGFGVRQGILASKGSYVLFMDVDLSVPLEFIDQAVAKLQEGWEAVIGSRSHDRAEIKVRQPLHRRLGSCIFNSLRDALVGLSQYGDTQCGFKAFQGDLARRIFGRSSVDGFMFDVEILRLLTKENRRVHLLPVQWADVPGSKLRLGLDTARMFRDLLRIRFNHGK